MKFDEEMIVSSFREFWKSQKDVIKFRYEGRDVSPTEITGLTPFQMEEGEFCDGYNFACNTLGLRAEVDGVEKTFKGEFTIKVQITMVDDSQKPVEKVTAVKNNTIYLKD